MLTLSQQHLPELAQERREDNEWERSSRKNGTSCAWQSKKTENKSSKTISNKS